MKRPGRGVEVYGEVRTHEHYTTLRQLCHPPYISF